MQFEPAKQPLMILVGMGSTLAVGPGLTITSFTRPRHQVEVSVRWHGPFQMLQNRIGDPHRCIKICVLCSAVQ